MLKLENVSGGYPGNPVLKHVSFAVQKGELFGILGPNGSGKTTLLKMLSGILPYQKGSILVKDRSIRHYTAKELAQLMAVLPQISPQNFSYTVKEVVALGRYPHQKGLLHAWGEEDEAVIQRVMKQTHVKAFENHSIRELSGGEQQRVYLAQALAQEPELLLLDEPTNHLDLSYQKGLFDLLKQWTVQKKLTVISIFHDLNLAGLYCDRLLLLQNGEVQVDARPDEVLKEARVKNVYRTEVKKMPHPKVPAPQMLLLPERDSSEDRVLDATFLDIQEEWIAYQAPFQLRTLYSGVMGAGTGWYRSFVNRHVNQDEPRDDLEKVMALFLHKNGFEPSDTVGVMSSAFPEDVSCHLYKRDGFSLFVVVTAAAGSAVKASGGEEHALSGTTWLFIHGELSEEAFIQSMITATETKVNALRDSGVMGKTAIEGRPGHVLVAATQKGKKIGLTGPVTPLVKLISQGVEACTREALQKSRRREV
ncbi:ATP-binding cassette domain-containing protein [Sporolactobacillus sp. Y61]|uniref:ATP-binding cassette domain-containing protein n=1 Tax=Sporolactobacillus sp. Y61 TaxID=3160863 RepID=A0AAU8IIE5_9BACL